MKTVQVVIIICFLFTQAFSQNPAVPFLRVNTDARSSSLGEITVVSNCLNQPYHLLQNPSLTVGKEADFGFSFGNYFWLNTFDLIFMDINLFGAINKKNSLAMTFRLFSLEDTHFTDVNGQILNMGRQKEFAVSLRYSRLLGKHFALGAGFKYIQSDLGVGFQVAPGNIAEVGRSYAADIGVDYRNNFKINDRAEYKLNIGLAIMNMGAKIGYPGNSSDENFIPTTMNFGLMNSFRVAIAHHNIMLIHIGYQTDKLLIPTSSVNAKQNPLKAMFTSFSDAPGGAKEELHEFRHHLGWGGEYIWKDKILAGINSGISLQNENKGSKYYLVGFYFGAYWFHIDFAYRHALKYPEKYCQLTIGFDLHFKSHLKAKFYN